MQPAELLADLINSPTNLGKTFFECLDEDQKKDVCSLAEFWRDNPADVLKIGWAAIAKRYAEEWQAQKKRRVKVDPYTLKRNCQRLIEDREKLQQNG